MPNSLKIQDGPYFKTIDNAAPDIIIRIGRDRIFRRFDGNLDDLYWQGGTCLNKSIDAVMPQDSAQRLSDALERTFTTGLVQHLEYTLTSGDRTFYYNACIVKYSDDEAIVLVRNITRKRKDEQELTEQYSLLERRFKNHRTNLSRAERKYQDIFHHSGAPSIIVEQDRTISMANQKFSKFIKFSRDEIEGHKMWTDFVHPLDRDMATMYHFARRQGAIDVPGEYECRFVDRNSAIKSVIVKVGFLSDPGRTVISIIDITSLKQKEKTIRDRESLYSAILEGYDGLIYIIDKSYHIQFTNEKVIQLLGKDVMGKICYQVIHNRQSKCHWCVAEQVFEGNRVRFEIKNPHDKKWYYSVNVPVTLSDNSIFCQTMIVDIDEAKKNEEALRASEAHFREENSRLRSSIDDRQGFGDIVGKSRLMQEVYELLLLAASSENNVILYGESGTGKELAAKTIHDMSNRRTGRFVPINCGAIPQNLLESEFFGYKKGAFTGAHADKAGLLDEADKGSLFLDEIGEIETGFQVKLLRAIEGGGYTPVGGSKLLRPDLRIIAATNRNLTERVKKGEMRSDFFYRIHVIPIYLPPLRNRKQDIPLLIEHFLKAYDRKIRPRITSNVMQTMMEHDWPGNVRELQNVLYRFVTLKRLDLNDTVLPAESSMKLAPAVSTDTSLADAVAGFEKQVILSALDQFRWNRTQAARHLGIGLRTLQRKMKLYSI